MLMTRKRKRGGQRAEGIYRRRSNVLRHAPDLDRDGVVGADGLQGAREFVIGQGEAEQRHGDHARQQDRHHHQAHRLQRERSQDRSPPLHRTG